MQSKRAVIKKPRVMPLNKYWIILALSIKRPITPDVKRKTDLSKLKAVRKELLTAPPTPKTPEKNPESVPPSSALEL